MFEVWFAGALASGALGTIIIDPGGRAALTRMFALMFFWPVTIPLLIVYAVLVMPSRAVYRAVRRHRQDRQLERTLPPNL